MSTTTLPRSPSPSQLNPNTTTTTSNSACGAPPSSPSAHSCCSEHHHHDTHTHHLTSAPSSTSLTSSSPCRDLHRHDQHMHQHHATASSSTAPTSPPSCCHHHQHKPEQQSDELKHHVRRIMRSDATSTEKALQIHKLFAAQRAEAAEAAQAKLATKRGMFPGQGAAAGCEHYKRKCWILAPCCDRYYPCRRCHDEAENHEIDRRAIQKIACVVCGDKDQPVSATCRTCGVRFAKYFCEPCRLYNDDDSPGRTAYHCDKCGICRVGLGLGIDNHHCDRCNTCVPIDRIHDHPCRERNLDANCPICTVHLATSTESSYVLPCSHPIHVKCLEKYVKAGNYTCPLCSKSILDKDTMQKWYKTLDERLVHDEMPPEFQNRMSRVLCNDCETKTVTKFHFRFHKCDDCGGYNTKVLEQWDQVPEPGGEVDEHAESVNDTNDDETH